MGEEVRLCKDCKWMRVGILDRIFRYYRFARCANPIDGGRAVLVDGSGGLLCGTRRGPLDLCGLSGDLWEPKK